MDERFNKMHASNGSLKAALDWALQWCPDPKSENLSPRPREELIAILYAQMSRGLSKESLKAARKAIRDADAPTDGGRS
jgi:hypothetical protein